MAKNDQFSLLHYIFQEPCIIWLSFMVHTCKMIISPVVFFSFFQNFNLWVVRGGGGRGVKGEKLSKMTKILSVVFHISGTIHDMIVIYGTQVLINNISRFFFFLFFFKILKKIPFFSFFKREKNDPKWQKFCLSHFVSQEPYII